MIESSQEASGLHDQRSRGRTSPVPQVDQNRGRICQRKQFTEIAVCGYQAGVRALDSPGAGLEAQAIATRGTF